MFFCKMKIQYTGQVYIQKIFGNEKILYFIRLQDLLAVLQVFEFRLRFFPVF